MKKAFTLIELLVVVIIIGILAAIALPQYQKAVTRSRAAQGITMLKSVYQAALEYQMANGTWPEKFSDLSVSPSWTGTEKWYTDSAVKDVLSDNDWSLQLTREKDKMYGLSTGQLSGKYAGGGFFMWNKYTYSNQMPLNSLVCAEKIAQITTPGTFCQKVMQSKKYMLAGSVLRYYEMP